MPAKDKVRLGVRGRVRAGVFAGQWVVVDVAGMTPVDPLVVVTSADLDTPGHPTELATWVDPEDLDEQLDLWGIEWTNLTDNETANRHGP